MPRYKYAAAAAIAAAVLSGCTTPEQFESAPVEVATRSGAVTCQLYTTQLTSWDRSISRPDSMSVQAADAVCRKEGRDR